MFRLFVLAFLFFLIVYLFKRKVTAAKQQPSAKKSNDLNNFNETMVKCAQCGVHHPVSESLSIDDQHYCSEAHLPPP